MTDRDDTINRPFDESDIPGFLAEADAHRRPPETLVHYHVEDGVGRPAINVKDRHAGMDYIVALERLAGPMEAMPGTNDNTGPMGIAYDRVQSDFWQAAQEIATQRGLGEVTQQGRSGGWLVFTTYDPAEHEDADTADADTNDRLDEIAQRTEWLAGYRSMVEWAEAWIADAPRKVAALAQQYAMDEAGYPAAARMFGFGAGIPAATWAYEGGAPRGAFS